MTEQEWNKLNERKLKDWSVLRSFMDANPQMSYESLFEELIPLAQRLFLENAQYFKEVYPTYDQELYMREVTGWVEILTLLNNRYL